MEANWRLARVATNPARSRRTLGARRGPRLRTILALTASVVALGAVAGCTSERGAAATLATSEPSAGTSTSSSPAGTAPSPTSVASATHLSGQPLDSPVVINGPFGAEYAPLHSDHVLVATVPIEQMRAMDYKAFAKLPIADRLNYEYTEFDASGDREHTYFDVDSNFVPGLVVNAWSQTLQYSFFSDGSPEECAKLAISNYRYPIDPNTNDLRKETEQTAQDFLGACQSKQPGANFVTAYILSKQQPTSVRKNQITNDDPNPEPVTLIGYDIYNQQTVTGHETVEAFELTIKLSSGKTVVGYAVGFAV